MGISALFLWGHCQKSLTHKFRETHTQLSNHAIDPQEHRSRSHQGNQNRIRSEMLFSSLLHPRSCRTSPVEVLATANNPPSPDQVTIERMTTQGRFNFDTIAWDSVDLPEPEEPAIPMMETSAQGGL